MKFLSMPIILISAFSASAQAHSVSYNCKFQEFPAHLMPQDTLPGVQLQNGYVIKGPTYTQMADISQKMPDFKVEFSQPFIGSNQLLISTADGDVQWDAKDGLKRFYSIYHNSRGDTNAINFEVPLDSESAPRAIFPSARQNFGISFITEDNSTLHQIFSGASRSDLYVIAGSQHSCSENAFAHNCVATVSWHYACAINK